jgi:hypothetical protein
LASGDFNSHITPSGSYTNRTVPPKSFAMNSLITRLPNPWRVGITRRGPPRSCHRNRNVEISFANVDHEISTPPSDDDGAPYFNAFVASSLTASVSETACLGATFRSGPETLNLPSPERWEPRASSITSQMRVPRSAASWPRAGNRKPTEPDVVSKRVKPFGSFSCNSTVLGPRRDCSCAL